MAGGNVSPRQKMINMMYLVLIALLALNVSKEILKAFHLMETGFAAAGKSLDQKNEQITGALASALTKEGAKAKPFVDRAEKVRALAAGLCKYIQDTKVAVEKAAEGRKTELEPGQPYGELVQPDNMEKHANYFTIQGYGKKLQDKINQTRIAMLKLVEPGPDAPGINKSIAVNLAKSTQLYASDPTTKDADGATWVSMYLEHSPLAGVVALLSKIQNDAKNLETDILTNLAKEINAKDINFDRLEAMVIAPSSYIMSGEKYEATVILTAYNSTASNFSIQSSGGQLPIAEGKGKYSTTVSGQGKYTFSGNIMVNGPDGVKPYPFKTEYQSFLPMATISPEAMNILYIGLDNPISISVPGVNPSDVQPTSSGCVLTAKGGGKFVARVSAPGEASIGASAKGKSMGSMKFRIRRVPNPETQVGALPPGDVSSGALAGQVNVACFLPNFPFDGVKYNVVKYSILITGKKREPYTPSPTSGSSFGIHSGAIRGSKSGDKVIIYNIAVVGPDGQQRPLTTSLVYTLK